MKKTGDWWFPEGETHLIEWISNPKNKLSLNGREAYQGKKQSEVISKCKSFGTAVDIGGHVGLWSYNLSYSFNSVHAFEPVQAHRDCFTKNVLEHRGNVTLHACALGYKEGSIEIRTEVASSGDSRVNGPGDIPLKPLDSFKLKDVDLIKIDCEGYELFALMGAVKTIKKFKPVIIVEQKPGHAQRYGLGEKEAVSYLKGLGYHLIKEMAGDFILSTRKD
jgi:FkbM family methyltransferase